MASNKIQLKRTSVAGRTPSSGQLDVGELAINLVDNRLFTKDGSSNVIDVFGQSLNSTASVAFANLTLTTLTANTVEANNANVTLLFAGNTTITGSANVTVDLRVGGNTRLGTDGNDTIIFGGMVASDLVPSSNNLYDLGNSGQRWDDIYGNNLRVSNGFFGGAVSGITTLAAGNTTVTGFANVTSTLQVGGTAQFGNDVTISGNLIINGTTTYVNTSIFNVSDEIITLNADLGAVSPTANVGFEVNRGSEANVSLLWDEGNDRWSLGNTYISGTAQTTGNTTVGDRLLTSANGIQFNDGTQMTTFLDPIVYAIALG